MNIHFLQGSEATDLRGCGSFNFSFPCSSILNLTVRNNENWCTFVEVIVKIKQSTCLRHCECQYVTCCGLVSKYSVLWTAAETGAHLGRLRTSRVAVG